MVFAERKNPPGNFFIPVDIQLHWKWPLLPIYGMEERRVDESRND